MQRFTIHGEADAPDTVSGIVFRHNEKASGLKSAEKSAVEQKGIDRTARIAEENAKRVPFAENTAAAKGELNEENERHTGVEADEKKDKANTKREREEEEKAAQEKRRKSLAEQATFLKTMRKGYVTAFEEETTAVNNDCKASKDELNEEGRVIREVQAKIKALKVVGQMTAKESEEHAKEEAQKAKEEEAAKKKREEAKKVAQREEAEKARKKEEAEKARKREEAKKAADRLKPRMGGWKRNYNCGNLMGGPRCHYIYNNELAARKACLANPRCTFVQKQGSLRSCVPGVHGYGNYELRTGSRQQYWRGMMCAPKQKGIFLFRI